VLSYSAKNMIVNSHFIHFTFLIEATNIVMGERTALKAGMCNECCPAAQQPNKQNFRSLATLSTDRSVISCDSKWHRLIQTTCKVRCALPLGIPTHTSKTWQSPPNTGKENEGALMIDLGKRRAVHTNHQPSNVEYPKSLHATPNQSTSTYV
jgi:hypothetical protein